MSTVRRWASLEQWSLAPPLRLLTWHSAHIHVMWAWRDVVGGASHHRHLHWSSSALISSFTVVQIWSINPLISFKVLNEDLIFQIQNESLDDYNRSEIQFKGTSDTLDQVKVCLGPVSSVCVWTNRDRTHETRSVSVRTSFTPTRTIDYWGYLLDWFSHLRRTFIFLDQISAEFKNYIMCEDGRHETN